MILSLSSWSNIIKSSVFRLIRNDILFAAIGDKLPTFVTLGFSVLLAGFALRTYTTCCLGAYRLFSFLSVWRYSRSRPDYFPLCYDTKVILIFETTK